VDLVDSRQVVAERHVVSFDRLAPFYRGMEFVLAGGKMQRRRCAFLDEVKESQTALLVGEGPGRFLIPLLRANPRVQATCLESSEGMTGECRAALAQGGYSGADVDFVTMDARRWVPPTGRYDLIATHFFLDCFPAEELRRVTQMLAAAGTPGGRWLISDFRLPPKGLSRLRARALLALMYGFFRAVTALPARRLEPPDQYLEANGFRLAKRQLSDAGFLHSDLWIRSG